MPQRDGGCSTGSPDSAVSEEGPTRDAEGRASTRQTQATRPRGQSAASPVFGLGQAPDFAAVPAAYVHDVIGAAGCGRVARSAPLARWHGEAVDATTLPPQRRGRRVVVMVDLHGTPQAWLGPRAADPLSTATKQERSERETVARPYSVRPSCQAGNRDMPARALPSEQETGRRRG